MKLDTTNKNFNNRQLSKNQLDFSLRNYLNSNVSIISNDQIRDDINTITQMVEKYVSNKNRLDLITSDLNQNQLTKTRCENWNIDGNKLSIDLEYNIRKSGLNSGVYNTRLIFYQLLLNSNLYVSEISDNRTEMEIRPVNTSTEIESEQQVLNIMPKPDNKSFEGILPSIYDEQGNVILVTDWLIDYTKSSKNGVYPILVKLDSELPEYIEQDSIVSLIVNFDNNLTQKVRLIPSAQEFEVNILNEPNFKAVETSNKSDTSYKNIDLLLASGSSINSELETYYNSDSTHLNIDFRKFENHILYGSAYVSLTNFMNKVKQIESYESSLNMLTTQVSSDVTQSDSFINNKVRYEEKIKQIKSNFSDFEKFMYYESGSYVTSSYGEFLDVYWPKQNQTKPYELYSVTSSEVINWYDNLIELATFYDQQNPYNLVSLIPEYITIDEYNSNFIDLVNMIGNTLDVSWQHVSHSILIHDQNESIYEGMSRNILETMFRSSGFYGYNDYQIDDLWDYIYGRTKENTYATESNDGLTIVSSSDEIPSSKEQYLEVTKRLLNNVPLFKLTKGTVESYRSLINCFGVPKSILDVTEFGTSDPKGYVSYYDKPEFYYELIKEPNSYMTISNIHTGSMEFGFSTTYISKQYFINDGASNGFYLDSDGRLFLESDSFGTTQLTTQSLNDGTDYKLLLNMKPVQSSYYYDVYIKTADHKQIDTNIHVQTTESYDVFDNTTSIYFYEFSGSLSELRFWTEPLSESVFDTHVLDPLNYSGNQINSSMTELIRYPLGSDMHIYNHSVTSSISSSEPPEPNSNMKFNNWPDQINYKGTNKIRYIEWPDNGSFRKISDKVRIDDNQLYQDRLDLVKSVEEASYDKYPVDTGMFGVYFSVSKEIDLDISEQLGRIELDDYIGDPANEYKEKYDSLVRLQNKYYRKFNAPYRTSLYNRLVSKYNQSLFEYADQMSPARSKPTTGIVVESHLLHRNKQTLTKSKPVFENFSLTSSIETKYETADANNNQFTTSIDDLNEHTVQGAVLHNHSFIEVDTSIIYYKYNYVFYEQQGQLTGSFVERRHDSYMGVQNIIDDYAPSNRLETIDINNNYVTSSVHVPFQKMLQNIFYEGSKLTANSFNEPSTQVPDGSPVIEYSYDGSNNPNNIVVNNNQGGGSFTT